MGVTPFIKPIKVQGGTFYTCLSSQEDLNYTLDNTKRKFRFSNFALLKLPKLKALKTDKNEDLLNSSISKPNYIQLDAIAGANKVWYNNANSLPNVQNNIAFATSFENYFYNLETVLTSNDLYNIDEKRTVSERVFFKWLKEIGAIRFRQANNNEVVPPSSNFGTRFVEEDETFDINGNPIYERVVKYIGNINVVNSIRNNKNSFTEVYIHIPVSHGCTKDVLFDSITDGNYSPGKIFQTKNVGQNEGYLEGRNYDDVNPSGLITEAFFDSKDSYDLQSRLWYLDPITNTFIKYGTTGFKWWYDHSSVSDDSYYLEPLGFSDVLNEVYAIGHTDSSDPNDPGTTDHVKFIRNRLDGISLEFNPNVYQKIKANSDITSLGEFDASRFANNFSFNTVLVYYDLYDVDDPDNFTTNLFGVLFLDNVDYIPGDGGIIPSLNKYKPNELLHQNGNSYAFRLNIKFDVNAQDAAVEININDYNTFSLQLYLDALSGMKLMSEKMDEFVQSYKNLSNEVQNLKSLVFTEQSIDELTTRIDNVEKKMINAEEVFLNNDSLVALINKNYNEISNIYKNYTSIDMSYNLDVIKQGSGIEVDRSNGTNIIINNNRQAFSLNNKPVITLYEDFALKPNLYSYYHKLNEFDNYIRIHDGSYGSPYIVDRDIVIYIDDSDIKWKKGQRLRISFSYGLNMNNTNGAFNILLYSDAKDLLNTGYVYNTQVGIITYDNFNSNNHYKPILEIICLDPDLYKFVVDIF